MWVRFSIFLPFFFFERSGSSVLDIETTRNNRLNLLVVGTKPLRDLSSGSKLGGSSESREKKNILSSSRKSEKRFQWKVSRSIFFNDSRIRYRKILFPLETIPRKKAEEVILKIERTCFVFLAFEAVEAETIASVLFLDFINSLKFSLSLNSYVPI